MEVWWDDWQAKALSTMSLMPRPLGEKEKWLAQTVLWPPHLLMPGMPCGHTCTHIILTKKKKVLQAKERQITKEMKSYDLYDTMFLEKQSCWNVSSSCWQKGEECRASTCLKEKTELWQEIFVHVSHVIYPIHLSGLWFRGTIINWIRAF